MHSTCPRLWVVATPLGNPGDLSPRAREILVRADLILAEDTRRTGLLFKRLDLEAKGRMLSFHEHNEEARLETALDALRRGEDVALVSDAGTPLLSDPGYRLVSRARQEGLAVSPVPGASAITAALSASGLPPYPFTFLGFLPRKAGEQKRLLERFADLEMTLVFFERKNRVAETLSRAAEILGPREFCLARELTKTHEEFIMGSLGPELELPEELLGEVTVVLGPPRTEQASEERIDELLLEELRAGARTKEAARRVKERVQGWPSKELYARADELARQERDT